jgi:hypothetical protein
MCIPTIPSEIIGRLSFYTAKPDEFQPETPSGQNKSEQWLTKHLILKGHQVGSLVFFGSAEIAATTLMSPSNMTQYAGAATLLVPTTSHVQNIGAFPPTTPTVRL